MDYHPLHPSALPCAEPVLASQPLCSPETPKQRPYVTHPLNSSAIEVFLSAPFSSFLSPCPLLNNLFTRRATKPLPPTAPLPAISCVCSFSRWLHFLWLLLPSAAALVSPPKPEYQLTKDSIKSDQQKSPPLFSRLCVKVPSCTNSPDPLVAASGHPIMLCLLPLVRFWAWLLWYSSGNVPRPRPLLKIDERYLPVVL
jgi:hypothetical protein